MRNRRAIIAVIAAVICLVTGILMAIQNVTSHAATVEVTGGTAIKYGDGNYEYEAYTRTDNLNRLLYCTDPGTRGVAPGDTESYGTGYLDDDGTAANKEIVRAALYWGPGGPKYDANDQLWQNLDGAPKGLDGATWNKHYIAVHLLVSSLLQNDPDYGLRVVGGASLEGTDDGNWWYDHVLSNGGNTLWTRLAAKVGELPSESTFKVVTINWTQDDGKQSYITAEYHPTSKGRVQKVSANTAVTDGNPNYSLANAEFGLYKTPEDANKDANRLDTLTTGADGISNESSDHEGGIYYVKELKAPKGFIINPEVVQVTIVAGGPTATVTVSDQPILASLKAVKRDAETKQVVKEAGFTFRLLGSDGKTPYKTSDGKSDYTTDDTGTVTFPNLPLGVYYVQEIAAKVPYAINNTPVRADLSNVTSSDPVSVYVDDTPVKAEISLVKSDSENKAPVKGAKFRLYSKSKVTVNGNQKYAAGQDLSKLLNGDKPYETDASGKITVSGLYVDESGTSTFYFQEVEPAPDGYVADTTTKHEVSVTYAGATTPTVTAKPIAVTNKPNGITLTKTLDDGSGEAPKKLAGATFWLWKKSDEVHVDPENGRDSYILRINGSTGDEKVIVQQVMDYAEVTVAKNDKGYSISLRDSKGNEYQATTDAPTKVPEDVYDVTVRDKDGNAVNATGKVKLATENGSKATYTVKNGTDGKAVLSFEQGQVDDSTIDAEYSAKTRTFNAAKLKPSTLYDILVDGSSVYRFTTDETPGKTYYGRYDASAKGYNYKRQPMLLASDSRAISSFSINGKSYAVPQKTDENGNIVIERIPAGEYGFGEVDVPNTREEDSSRAPLISTEVTYITVGPDGKVNKQTMLNVSASNVETHVPVSKNEITGGSEIPGAHLEIHDSHGNVVEEWTSTDTPHEITGLTPGKYTLVEVMTPNNYDQATRVEFWIYDTDKVQKVEMHDQPIHINALIDKRQEIADPVAENTEANGDGKNKADVTQSNEGKYLYSLDYKNDSNTWVDEFTVYDPLDGVSQGYVRLNALTTAQAYEDFDGKLNVWYQTNKTPSDYADDQYKANATKDDGHDNAWLTNPNDDIKSRDTDGDGRILSYVGWKLWKKDVDATQATTLSVNDLGLADGEYVTGIRLEYGRVEEGFTTRPDGWDRTDLKDDHDDMKPVEQFHAGTFKVDGYKAVLSNIGTIETYLNDYLNALYPSDDADAANGNANTNANENDTAAAAVDAVNGNGNGNGAASADSGRAKVEKEIGAIRDRISEGANSSDERAMRAALDDLENAVQRIASQVLSERNVSDAKSLNQAVETFQQAYGRVKVLLPADVTTTADAAINTAKAAAAGTAGSDDIEKARKGLEDAVTPILDALTADATSSDVHYAATILDMQLTDKYVPGMNLDNSAHVDAYPQRRR